ncbi:hypothetical protein HXX76_012817 [Chlamydomonas incerta]|uniref:Uncharacterized protein n=1 Tax=Chlamydomonas incerta TaxID=51695 RepID=A0A835VT16_CHLIN|nr:hypothetical protein HXX76_012817 [Chlamydomonas incerta]|eukprot:KAG2426760.1 hypothetical protein HXX76_012817 [Chlamydomonas incerta]
MGPPGSPNSGLPANYSALTGLRLLGLASMDLEAGPVPSSGFPQAWSALTNLQNLDLSKNRYLGGVLPQAWANLGSIVSIDVSNTGACGTIPPGLSSFVTPSGLPPFCELVNCRRYLTETLQPMIDSQGQPGSACNLTQVWPSSQSMDMWAGFTVNFTTFGTTPITDVIGFVLNSCYANNGNSFNVVLPSGLTCFSGLTQLNFNANNAAGPLPDGFTQLTQLQELWLADNILSGSLKASYSALTALTMLKLQNNLFTNTLPPEWSTMSLLAEISINDNVNLNGAIPSAWGNLTSLTTFSARNVGVGGQLPPAFSSLTKLSRLTFVSDTLSGTLPSEWSTLSVLSYLNIASTRATSTLTGPIPNAWFGFGGVPAMFSLQDLTISNTGASGTLPTSMWQITGLTKVDFSANRLNDGPDPTGFLIDYSMLTNLQSLNLADNVYLGGTVPSDWALTLNSLTYINLQNTGVCAPFPAGLNASLTPGTFVNSYCDDLRAAYNLVTNFKPIFDSTTPGVGCSLASWDLGTNPLCSNTWSGALCAFAVNTMGVNVGSLTSLQLLNCNAGGSAVHFLPGSFTEFGGSLRNLVISNSALTGTLPVELGQALGQLTKLDLSANMFTGPIPGNWNNLPNLVILRLYNNLQINGSIPSSWGTDLTSLAELNMGSMGLLRGPLPDSLGFLPNLGDITIQSNSLTGTLPIQWSSLSFLSNLVVGAGGNTAPGPSVNGTVPHDWFINGNLALLANLQIANTKVSGPLPDPGDAFQANFMGLTSLDLSSNLLSGTLPDSYQGFT